MSTQRIRTIRTLTGNPELVTRDKEEFVVLESLYTAEDKSLFGKSKQSYFFCFTKDKSILQQKFREGTTLEIFGEYRQYASLNTFVENIFAINVELLSLDKMVGAYPDIKDEVMLIGNVLPDITYNSETFEGNNYKTCYFRASSKYRATNGQKIFSNTIYKLLFDNETIRNLLTPKMNLKIEGKLVRKVTLRKDSPYIDVENKVIVKNISKVHHSEIDLNQSNDLISIRLNKFYEQI